MSLTSTLGSFGAGGALSSVISTAAGSLASASLDVFSAWVLTGTKAALEEVAQMIGSTTAPNLESTWFSVTYWKVAGVSTLLTVPFLFAAAVQSILHSDMSLLLRSVFGQLPLAMLAISVAAPVVMLLLAATDEMSALVSGAGTTGGAAFLDTAAAYAGTVSSLNGSPFFALVVGLLTIAAALALTLELLVREAAVYVVVLMLPLAFAAFVWPARRIWAIRLVELLVSLILAKFVIVAVLSLAGAALGQSDASISELLAAMALVLLSCFAPWALMRILPFTELGAHAAGSLRQEAQRGAGMASSTLAATATDPAFSVSSLLHRQAADAGQTPEWFDSDSGPGSTTQAEPAYGGTESANAAPVSEAAPLDGAAPATEAASVRSAVAPDGAAPATGATSIRSAVSADGTTPGSGGRTEPGLPVQPSLADEVPFWNAPSDSLEWSLGSDGLSGPRPYRPPAPEQPDLPDGPAMPEEPE